MSGHEAARVARDAATNQDQTWATLSGLMCWDAVVYCQVAAGRLPPAAITIGNHGEVISEDDTRVTTSAGMRAVPQGAFIGFFDVGRLMHAMIAVGHGLAAGNKNECIGIGAPVGWEILDLANRIDWNADGTAGWRHLRVYYRAM